MLHLYRSAKSQRACNLTSPIVTEPQVIEVALCLTFLRLLQGLTPLRFRWQALPLMSKQHQFRVNIKLGYVPCASLLSRFPRLGEERLNPISWEFNLSYTACLCLMHESSSLITLIRGDVVPAQGLIAQLSNLG